MWIAIASAAFIVLMYITLFRKRPEKEEELIQQGLYPYNFIDAGTYIAGLLDIDTPIEGILLYPQKQQIRLFANNKVSGQKEFLERIDTAKIMGIVKEGEAQKYRVILQWKDAGYIRDIIFEFKGNNADKRADRLYSRLNEINAMETDEDGLQQQLVHYLKMGNKLKAVALYKKVTGTGLVEAKAYVERL